MVVPVWIIVAGMFGAFTALELVLMFWRKQCFANAQLQLKRAKQETQDIAQLPLNNPNPQMQISENGILVFANPAALTLFPDLAERGFAHPMLQGIESAVVREVRFDGKTYDQTIIETRTNGEKTYVVYNNDITQRVTYEKELQRAHKLAEASREAAEAAKEARGEFLANMSHELRTPMNGIIGLSDILVEGGLDGEKQSLIEAVNSSARNLLILLNDILDFSKIEAGELTMESIPFDIRKIIGQIESLQRPMASQKGLAMESRIEDNVPQFLVGDPSRLQQILNNLISNALKFTENGTVTLRAYGQQDDTGHFVTNIAVQDTGIGIPPDKQRAVFEKFQQADSSTARKYGGTGLGLAITKDLTELMGGTIAIESAEGVGTTFTVTINAPIAEGHSEHVQRQESGGLVGVNLAAKLMIVDDHPINLLFMRQILTRMGFAHFDEATSGKQALDLFKHGPYDVIIMDCQMPEMDGFEATRAIRQIEEAATAPVIIAATADAMKGAEEKCMAAGMDDYISKPIEKDKLYAVLQRWIPGNEAAILDAETSTEKTEAKNSIMNWEQFNGFTGGDADAEREILAIFLDNLESDIAALQKSFDAQDYTEWDEWVHKLYGGCSHIGADALAKICDEGQSLSVEQSDDIARVHNAVLLEYQRVLDYLQDRQKSAA